MFNLKNIYIYIAPVSLLSCCTTYEIIHVQNITIYYIPVFTSPPPPPQKKKLNTAATPNTKAKNVLGLKITSYGKLNLSKVCYVETKYRIMGKIL
jgi:hypothetical protein